MLVFSRLNQRIPAMWSRTSADFSCFGIRGFTLRAFVLSGLVLAGGCLASPVAQATEATLPQNLEAKVRDGEIYLTWDEPASGGEFEVSSYIAKWFPLPQGSGFPRMRTLAEGATEYTITGLTNGQEYEISLSARNKENEIEGEASRVRATPTSPAAPSMPQDLMAVLRNTAIGLTWKAPASDGGFEVTKYKLAWRQLPGESTSRMAVSGSAAEYTITGLTNEEKYEISLSAENKVGESQLARVVAVPTQEVPLMPQNLMAKSRHEEIYLTWERSAYFGHQEYELLWDPPNSASASSKRLSVHLNDYTITGLMNGQKYEISLLARNSEGESLPARTLATPGMVTVPSMPLNLVAKPRDKRILLTWEPPVSDGGADLSSYRVTWTPKSIRGLRKTVPLSSDPSGAVMFLLNSEGDLRLRNGVRYTIEVAAINAVQAFNFDDDYGRPGGIQASPVARVFATPMTATLPSMPQNLVAKARGNNAIRVSWDAPASDGGSDLTSYKLSWDPPNLSGFSTAFSTLPDAVHKLGNYYSEGGLLPRERNYTITGLQNGQEHAITLSAFNAQGEGPSIRALATPSTVTVPSVPRNLVAKPGDRRILLTWEKPASDGGADLTSYKVTWDPDGSAVGHRLDVRSDSQRSALMWNLQRTDLRNNNVRYTIGVSAFNAVQAGNRGKPGGENFLGVSPAARVLATPIAPMLPSMPLKLMAKPRDRAIDLTWEPPASDGRAALTRYKLSWQPAGGVVLPASAIGYKITGLANGERNTITLAARNEVGEGPSTQVLATPALQPPSVPQNVVAKSMNMAIGLTWNKPASDGGSALTTYKLSWNPSSRGGVSETTVSASVSEYTITNLTNGQKYTITLLAENAIGESPSIQVSTTPMATVPSTPLKVVAEGGEGLVYLTWEVPASDGGSALTTYRVSWETENLEGSTLRFMEAVPATMTKYTITNLVDWNVDTDTQVQKRIVHEIMLSAENEVGEGPPARVSSTSGIMPATPRNVVAVALDRAIRVTWELPLSEIVTNLFNPSLVGTEAVISLLSWGPASEGLRGLPDSAGMIDFPVTPTVHTITGLINGVEYAILVSVVNTFGEAGVTARVLSTPGVVPTTPRDVMAVALDTAIGLTWEAPASDGGSVLTGYKLSWQLADGSGSLSEVTVPAEPTAAVITGLTNDVRYEVSLLASNTVSEGPSIEVFSTPTAVFPELDIDIERFALGAVSTAGRVIVPGNLASGGAVINPSALLQGGSPASGRVCIVSEESSEVADNCLMQEADTRVVPAFGSKLYGVSGTKWISQRIYVAPVIGFSHGTQRRSSDSGVVNLDLRLSSTAAETFKNTGGSGFEFDLNSMTHRLTGAAEVLPVEFTSVASTSIKLTKINGAAFGGGAIDFGSDIEGLISAKRLFALGNSEVELLEPKESSPPLIEGVVVDNMAQHSTELITFNKRTTITFTAEYAVKIRRYSTETTSLATDRSLSSTATEVVIDIAGSAPTITFDGSTPRGIAGSGSNIFEIILSSGEESTGISVLGGVPTHLSNADGAEGFTLATSGSVVPGFYAYETNTADQVSNPRITANTLNLPPLPDGRTVDDAARDFGVFDFIVSDLAPGGVATVVLRLIKEAGQREAGWQYHKYQQGFDGGEWSPYVRMGRDKIFSAPAPCPSAHASREPDEGGDGSYTWHLAHDGIRNKDRCLLLEIEDGSVNDADGRVNAIVSDPGTLAGKISGIGGGGGGMDLWWLILLLGGMALGTALTWRRSPLAGFLTRIDSGTHSDTH